jgi:ribulose-phosphate 3-epimerase
VKIAPSVLAYDPANLRGAVEIATKGGADLIHLDVIDGHFAPNITFGPATIKALRHSTRIPFDTHLMISRPRQYIHEFLDAGSNRIILHLEEMDEAVFDTLFAIINSYDKDVGVALKPGTELPKWMEKRLARIATVLILTVNPGFSGQRMDKMQFPKIERISKLVDEQGLNVDIEVDGGITAANVAEVARLGGNCIVAGAGIYSQPDPVKAIADLREAAKAARSGS